MTAKRLAQMLLAGQMLTACLQAPAVPNFVIKYSGDGNPQNPPAPAPGPEPTPDPENKPLPTTEEIQAAPVQSGIALYTFYCESCHRPYEDSSKREIGITAGYIRDAYVRNFPPHRGRPWPKDEYEAYGIEKALAVPKEQEPADAPTTPDTPPVEEDTSDLPSLDPEDEKEEGPPTLLRVQYPDFLK